MTDDNSQIRQVEKGVRVTTPAEEVRGLKQEDVYSCRRLMKQ